jgi:tetratricopeptide (TPR) repeat protein
MQANEIIQRSNTIYRLIQSKQLKIAFDAIRRWAIDGQMVTVHESLNELEFNYRLLIQYVEEGVNDPQREHIYKTFVRQAFHLVDILKEEWMILYASGYEYVQLRDERHNHEPEHDFVSELEDLSSGHVLISFLEGGNNNDQRKLESASKHEQLRIKIFRQIWLSSEMSIKQLNPLLSSDFIGVNDKAFFVTALTLFLIRQFDEERLGLLLEACLHNDELVCQRALVGLWAVTGRYNERLSFYPNFEEQLQLLKEDGGFLSSMQTIMIQFIRTAETEKISKKIQEEILPEMMKIAPQLKDKLDMESWMSPEELEDKNPDWQEMIEKSGVADKLMEMSELQIQGADVYMNTFAQLKQYPFFSEVVNWLLPFDKTYSAISDLFDKQQGLFSALVNSSFLCNSDKYSLAFSLKSLPDAQRNTMMQAFKIENEQYKEAIRDGQVIPGDGMSEQISNQYIQDLYRFLKLNPYRKDFYPIFDHALSLHQSWMFDRLQFSIDQQTTIAEFYFIHEHYSEAFELFQTIVETSEASNTIFQKMGFCLQQKGDFQHALEFYLRAEALVPTQKWLTRKIAFCYKMIGNVDEALSYYRLAESLESDNFSIQLQIGHLLVQQQHYEEALNSYFKVELSKSEPKVWRAIAWCSFLSGKKEQAEKYSRKIIEEHATKHDWLNYGHIAWAMGKRTEALNRYAKSVELFRDDHDDFFIAFERDTSYLIKAGIDPMEMAFMIDGLRYKLQNDAVM